MKKCIVEKLPSPTGLPARKTHYTEAQIIACADWLSRTQTLRQLRNRQTIIAAQQNMAYSELKGLSPFNDIRKQCLEQALSDLYRMADMTTSAIDLRCFVLRLE